MPRRVLITGTTGAVGPCVVRAFHDAGFFVRTFSLDPSREAMIPSVVENLVGDVTDRKAVASAIIGIDYIVHMAAMLHIEGQPPSMEAMYRRVNVDGTAIVVEASLRQNIRRIVFFSTIGVYGPSNGKIHSEETPPNPDNIYARTKLEAEKIVLAAKGAEGHSLGTVLRMSTIYGPRVKGNFRRLVRALAHRRFILVGNGNNRRTLIHDRDAATAAMLAAQSPLAAGRIYNVTDGRTYTMKEIVSVLSELLGRRAPRIAVPSGLAYIAVGALEHWAKTVGIKTPITKATINKVTEDMAVEGERIRLELGFSPRIDLMQGWSEAISEMRRAGDI